MKRSYIVAGVLGVLVILGMLWFIRKKSMSGGACPAVRKGRQILSQANYDDSTYL